MKCWDCPHFKIQYEPLRDSGGIWDFGRAKCTKHDLIVDFPDHRKLKKLICVEEEKPELVKSDQRDGIRRLNETISQIGR